MLNKTKIITLFGVFTNDLFDDEEACKEKYTPITNCKITKQWCEIPIKFNENTWPRKVNLHCSWCTLKIDTIPIPILTPIIDGYHPSFIVCSPSCAGSVIQTYITERQRWDVYQHTLIVIEKLGIAKLQKLPNAPPPHIMQRYSGDKGITESEYLKEIHQI